MKARKQKEHGKGTEGAWQGYRRSIAREQKEHCKGTEGAWTADLFRATGLQI